MGGVVGAILAGFDIEFGIATKEGSFDCFIEGSAMVTFEKDYGSDRDGNRGTKVIHVNDIDVDLITWMDENENYQLIELSEVTNKEKLNERIREYLQEKFENLSHF